MTDKERLEEIKSQVWKEKCTYAKGDDESRESYSYTLSDYDFEWLIQQAGKVEELELEINDWRAEVRKWQRFYKESEESHSETKELLKSIVNQNKRYREVLEEIARDRLPGASYKARQALRSVKYEQAKAQLQYALKHQKTIFIHKLNKLL